MRKRQPAAKRFVALSLGVELNRQLRTESADLRQQNRELRELLREKLLTLYALRDELTGQKNTPR